MTIVDVRVRAARPAVSPERIGAAAPTAARQRARIAVIDARGQVRALLARTVVADPRWELAVSSDRLEDLLGLADPPDLVVLGSGPRDAEAEGFLALVEARGSRILSLDPGSGAGSAELSSLLTCAERGSPGCHPCSIGPAINDALGGAADSSACCDRARARRAPQLSAQERRALALYVAGATLDSVAAAMYVTPNTAATYLRRVRQKLRAQGRAVETKLELREAAVEYGLLD